MNLGLGLGKIICASIDAEAEGSTFLFGKRNRHVTKSAPSAYNIPIAWMTH